MKISTILDHIDNGHMALPEFRRRYVSNRYKAFGGFDLLDDRRPVGAFASPATAAQRDPHRGYVLIGAGVVGGTPPTDLRALVSHVGVA